MSRLEKIEPLFAENELFLTLRLWVSDQRRDESGLLDLNRRGFFDLAARFSYELRGVGVFVQLKELKLD